MGVCLQYQSLGLIPRKRIDEYLKNAEWFVESREWWAESFGFYEPDYGEPAKGDWQGKLASIGLALLGISGGLLRGGLKIFLSGGYTDSSGQWTTVEAEEDNLMAYNDARAVTEFLQACTKSSKVGWQLYCDGEPCGQILTDGQIDRALAEFLHSFTTTFEPFDPSSLKTADSVRRISAKYASRW